MICATMVSFSQGFGPLSIAPLFPDLIHDFNTDLEGAIQFTGIAILVLGFSNFIWYVSASGIADVENCSNRLTRVPIATSFGRRPVMLASSLVCFGASIWHTQAQSYSSFMGSCVLLGIGAGPGEVGMKSNPALKHH